MKPARIGTTSVFYALLGTVLVIPARLSAEETGERVAPSKTPHASVAEPLDIGKMTPFWRNRPVIGRWLKGRLGLVKGGQGMNGKRDYRKTSVGVVHVPFQHSTK